MDLTLLITVALATLVGAAVQAASGFGAGLIAIPIMLAAGLSLPQSVGVVLGLVLIQTSWSCWKHREDVDWRATVPVLIPRLFFLPIGFALMVVLDGLDPSNVKLTVGLVVLAAVIMRLGFQPKPRQKIGYGWTLLSAAGSGILAGMVGMGGPFLVLWVLAHDWSSARARAFLWASFLESTPATIGLLVWKFGEPAAMAVGFGVLLAPVSIAGTWVGLRIANAMGPHRFRIVAYGLLVLTALSGIAAPLLSR